MNTNSNLLKFSNLSSQKELIHFSTTIKGGISSGNFATFNLGIYSGDIPENVVENRSRLASILEINMDTLYIPYQNHEDKIGIIDENFLSTTKEEQIQLLHGIDALITNQKNICIGITTADCVPVLLYDIENKVLAAVHAGWRGTVAKITAKTVTLMIEKYNSKTENIFAGIGPSICKDCFEVGEEVVTSFIDAGFSIEKIGFKSPGSHKHHLDLWVANKIILTESGILPENIETSELCTMTNTDLFFSARRQTLKSGRMVTGGMIKF